MDTAQQIVTLLAHGDFAAVEKRFADQIKPFIPEGTLQAIWQDALRGSADARFILYPSLSHLFMPIAGGHKATPATYTVAGHVAEVVIDDIGSWIKQQHL